MVEQLQQLLIDAVLITDVAAFALMPRIHCVLLGPQSGQSVPPGFGRRTNLTYPATVTAEGGAVAQAGSVVMAVIAQQNLVPVCICAGSYQFSTKRADRPSDFESYADPTPIWAVGEPTCSSRALAPLTVIRSTRR